MSKSNLLNLEKLEEKIKQHCQASDLYALIEKSISLLIAKTIDCYTNDEKIFLKENLCKIIARTIRYDHRSTLDDSILKLFMEITNLIVSTKLNPYAIQSLVPFFDIDYHGPDIFKLTTKDLDNVYDFTNSLINSKMKILKLDIPPLHEKFLNIFFDKSILNITLSMINSNEINIQQISSIINFFTKIQYLLDKRLSLSLTIYFAQYSIKLLTTDQYGSDGVSTILNFFKTFMNHLLNLHAEIFHLSTEMLHYQNQNQYDALDLFLSMIQDSKSTQNQKTIKKALLSLLQQTTNIKIFQKIYENMLMLSKEILFTDDDISNFVCYIRKIPNDANKIILSLLSCISSPFLKPSNNILLGLNLISCTDNDALSNLILERTIQNFDKKCNITSNTFKMTEKIAGLIISSLNMNQGNLDLINLGYFLSNFPRHDVIHEYIMKITEEEDFECYSPILKSLALSSTKFESEKLLSSFAQSVIDQFIGRRFTPRISRLTEVVVNWITNFSSIPENQIFSKLINIDYYKCPDEIPSVISALMSRRTSNRRLIPQLINKIMKDTVPEKHANWAINMAFDALHDEKKYIEKIAENLFPLLYESNKRSNVIYMIYQAVLYEADFFNIGKASKNSGMKIEATLNGQPFSFTIHPLHSTRRIYTEVGKFLQKRLFNFTLYVKGKEILPDQPLSSVPFKLDPNKKLNITVKVDDAENRNDYCRLHLQPYFIEYIQRTERFTSLFNLMNSFNTEGEILFLILNLVDDEMIKPVLSSPIQQIFRRDYFMSLVDLESFRLFPFVLDAAKGSKTVYSSGYLSTVFQKLNDQYLDQVTLLMTCRILSSCEAESCHFETSLIRKCLITSNKKNIREAMANVLTKTDESEKLLSLLSSTAQISNRNKTKQFFNLLKKKEINPHLVEPLFNLINQYETNFDGEVDQTINGIFSMDLNPTVDSFDLVFGFLFTPPTVCSKYLPFLHTLKSRKNAYRFILKYDGCINKVSSILSMVPMASNVKKLDDNFSYYKRGFLSPLNLNTSMLILLHSIESIRNYVISSNFQSPILTELSNLFFDMTFTCLPSIDINDYNLLLLRNRTPYSFLFDFLQNISLNQGLETQIFDMFQITCHNYEKNRFTEKCEKLITEKSSKIIFFDIDNPQHSKFKFPLFFGNYILRAVAIKSDDNDYSVIYRDREINDVTDLIDTRNNYLFNKHKRSCWFIAENNELSKYDISELPDRCFGGKKKKESAFLLVYECENIEITKVRVDKGRQERIDLKNGQNWPSVVCNSRGFINFARELFETNIDRHLKFGFEAFFKIAIIDDFSLNDWKNFLIEKVLIDERKSEIFLENFVSNETLFEKVDLSKNGTFILPELFSFAKKKFKIDFEKAFKLIQLFEKSTSQKQFGFVCDILTDLIVDSNLNLSRCKYLLNLLTENLKKIDPLKIYDRVLNCFEALMSCMLNFLEDSSDLFINDLIQTDFLEQWLKIGKKSDSFKLILESILNNNSEKLNEEASLIIKDILDNSQLPFSPLPSTNSPVLPNSPILSFPKRIKTIKLIKRKNRPNNEFEDQINNEQNSEGESIFDDFNDTNQNQNPNQNQSQNQQEETKPDISLIQNQTIETKEEEENNHNDEIRYENEHPENDNDNENEYENDDIKENIKSDNENENENESNSNESAASDNENVNESINNDTNINFQYQNQVSSIPTIFNYNTQADLNNITNVPVSNENVNNNNNNNEYSYSENNEEEEEEEEEENIDNNNNGGGINESQPSNLFNIITENVPSVNDTNNNSSDFIIISNSNSNSENNLTRNSNSNSNDNFIVISNSNDDIINNDENQNQNQNQNGSQSNNNNNNNDEMPFDFGIKLDSQTSDSSAE